MMDADEKIVIKCPRAGVDGITYFLQIKEIKLERLDKIGMLKRKLIKDKYKIHAKSLNLLLTSKFTTH